MTVRLGDKIRSILTGKVYEVKAIKDWVAVLESLDGSSKVWTEKDNLKLFYEKVERQEVLKAARSPVMRKPLRSPSKVILDFL
jgi:hypothetical protein